MKSFFVERITAFEQTNEDGGRAGDKHQRQRAGKADQHDAVEFVGVDEQSEDEEHADLHNPSQRILKTNQMAAIHERRVAENDTAEVNGQKTVAVQQLSQAECNQNNADPENGIEPLIDQTPFLQKRPTPKPTARPSPRPMAICSTKSESMTAAE